MVRSRSVDRDDRPPRRPASGGRCHRLLRSSRAGSLARQAVVSGDGSCRCLAIAPAMSSCLPTGAPCEVRRRRLATLGLDDDPDASHDDDAVAELPRTGSNPLSLGAIDEVRKAPDGRGVVSCRSAAYPWLMLALSGDALRIRRAMTPPGVSTSSVSSPRGGGGGVSLTGDTFGLGGCAAYRQHRLNFLPLPQGHGSLRPTRRLTVPTACHRVRLARSVCHARESLGQPVDHVLFCSSTKALGTRSIGRCLAPSLCASWLSTSVPPSGVAWRHGW
jgi:hypothetical protein